MFVLVCPPRSSCSKPTPPPPPAAADGVTFASHLGGASRVLGPRDVMTIQQNLGSDIAMVLDECPPWPAERDVVARAVARSFRWAQQCKQIAGESGFLAAGHH